MAAPAEPFRRGGASGGVLLLLLIVTRAFCSVSSGVGWRWCGPRRSRLSLMIQSGLCRHRQSTCCGGVGHVVGLRFPAGWLINYELLWGWGLWNVALGDRSVESGDAFGNEVADQFGFRRTAGWQTTDLCM